MKRTLKPTGSKYFSSSAKRVRQTPAPTYRRKYVPRSQNTYSAFQKSSGIERKILMILLLNGLALLLVGLSAVSMM